MRQASRFLPLLSLCLAPLVKPSSAQLVLSEIMFNAPESDYYEEFIELHNNYAANLIDLEGYRLGDQLEQDSLVDCGGGFILPPGGFALVLDPGYWNHSTVYDTIIPPEALILTISGNEFGTNGLRNDPPDTVILLNPPGQVIASFTYSSDNPNGYSEEKIRLTAGDDATNWANSLEYLGTPGFSNSLQPPNFDMAVINLAVDPSPLPYSSPLELIALLLNQGVQPTGSGEVVFALGSPATTIPDSILGMESFPDLPPADSADVVLFAEPLPPGPHRVFAWHSLTDDKPENDTLSNLLPGGYPQKSLIINEIFARPGGEGCEWVELYNPNAAGVDLWGFAFSDEDTSNRAELADSSVVIASGVFVLLAADSSIFDLALPAELTIIILNSDWPALNDYGDTPTIFDAAGGLQDAVPYAGWNIPVGISLERISAGEPSEDPLNWQPSSDPSGGTPGRANSALPSDFDLAVINLSANPSPLPYGSPLELIARLRNQGLQPAESGEIIFALGDPEGIIPDSVLGMESFLALAPADSTDIFLLVDPLPPGPHRVFAWHSWPDDRPENDTLNILLPGGYLEKSLIINEILACPSGEICEWVELFNPNMTSVDLWGFTFSDEDTSVRAELTESSIIIASDDFVLLAADSAIFSFQLPEDLTVIVLGNDWPVLNDNGDTPTIFDAAGDLQDAVPYTGWSIPEGISLERIYADQPSDDPLNWQPSLDPAGGTPGRSNSVQPSDFDLAILNLQADPSPLPYSSPLTLSVRLKNQGLEPVTGGEVIFALGSLEDEAPDTLVSAVDFPAIAPADSADINLTLESLPPGPHRVFAWHTLENDFRPENDTLSILLPGGYPEKSLIINEIFARTGGEGCEWVELYNPNETDVNLLGFAFSDADTADKEVLTDSSALVLPNDFILLAENSLIYDLALPEGLRIVVLSSSWPRLNDNGDTPTIFDAAGDLQDAVPYTGWTLPPGISIERILPNSPSDDPQNWLPSTDPPGGTPGRSNSAQPPAAQPTSSSLSFSPDPFDPDRHGTLQVTITVPPDAASAAVVVFDLRGRRLKVLFDGAASGRMDIPPWNGRDMDGRRLTPGLYVMFAEFRDSSGNRKQVIKNTLVIAGKL